MKIEDNNESQLPKTRGLRILKLLWEKFKRQPLYSKWVTLLVMLITLAVMLAFFSTFLIWKLITIIFTQLFLRLVDWYLMIGQNESEQ